MGNPIKMLAKLQGKTLIPTGEGFGGQGFDKMIIAGALAGLSRNAQMAALCIWCLDSSVTLQLAESLMWETYETEPECSGLKNVTALNLCQWVIQENKNPTCKQNKDTGMMEVIRLSNAALARKAGIKKQSFTDTHDRFYNSAVAVLNTWLNQAYQHVKHNLQEEAA